MHRTRTSVTAAFLWSAIYSPDAYFAIASAKHPDGEISVISMGKPQGENVGDISKGPQGEESLKHGDQGVRYLLNEGGLNDFTDMEDDDDMLDSSSLDTPFSFAFESLSVPDSINTLISEYLNFTLIAVSGLLGASDKNGASQQAQPPFLDTSDFTRLMTRYLHVPLSDGGNATLETENTKEKIERMRQYLAEGKSGYEAFKEFRFSRINAENGSSQAEAGDSAAPPAVAEPQTAADVAGVANDAQSAVPPTEELTESEAAAAAKPTEAEAPAAAKPAEGEAPAAANPTEDEGEALAAEKPTEREGEAPAATKPAEDEAPGATEDPTEEEAPAAAKPTEGEAPVAAKPAEGEAPAAAKPAEDEAPAAAKPAAAVDSAASRVPVPTADKDAARVVAEHAAAPTEHPGATATAAKASAAKEAIALPASAAHAAAKPAAATAAANDRAAPAAGERIRGGGAEEKAGAAFKKEKLGEEVAAARGKAEADRRDAEIGEAAAKAGAAIGEAAAKAGAAIGAAAASTFSGLFTRRYLQQRPPQAPAVFPNRIETVLARVPLIFPIAAAATTNVVGAVVDSSREIAGAVADTAEEILEKNRNRQNIFRLRVAE